MRKPAEEVIEHLVGMQAQEPVDPYVALWTRIRGFDPKELADLIEGKRALRAWMMRVTIHLFTSKDYLDYRALFQPLIGRALGNAPAGKALAGVDLAPVAAAARKVLEKQPLTRSELTPHLGKRWPDLDPDMLSFAAAHLLPLVQVPPRGVWGKKGKAAVTTPDAWLGRAPDPKAMPDGLIRRYLAAFGPASVADAANWSRLTGLREVFERLRPELRTFKDEEGRELFDVRNAPLPDPETPAPVRMMAMYDNALLGHADRTRIISDEHRRIESFGTNAVLIDGYARAAWRKVRYGKSVRIVVDPWVTLSKKDKAAVGEEAEALLRFLTEDAHHDVEFLTRP